MGLEEGEWKCCSLQGAELAFGSLEDQRGVWGQRGQQSLAQQSEPQHEKCGSKDGERSLSCGMGRGTPILEKGVNMPLAKGRGCPYCHLHRGPDWSWREEKFPPVPLPKPKDALGFGGVSLAFHFQELDGAYVLEHSPLYYYCDLGVYKRLPDSLGGKLFWGVLSMEKCRSHNGLPEGLHKAHVSWTQHPNSPLEPPPVTICLKVVWHHGF